MAIGQPGENIKKAKFSSNPDVDKFWLEYGKETIKTTLGAMDERAKYMITTCASLIVINFGLLLAFPSQNIQITPQFFFVVSAAFFAISYFPLKKDFSLFLLKSVKKAYQSWLRWKLIWHYGGFGLFVAGLLALAIANMQIQPTKTMTDTILLYSIDNGTYKNITVKLINGSPSNGIYLGEIPPIAKAIILFYIDSYND